MPQAILRNGKRFDVGADAAILNAALGQGIFLEYCCQTGLCDLCKTRIVSREAVVPQPEDRLTSVDRAAGHIPTRCRGGQDDVVIERSKAMPYASGSQAMIDAAGTMFKKRGLLKHHYHFNAFVSSASVE